MLSICIAHLKKARVIIMTDTYTPILVCFYSIVWIILRKPLIPIMNSDFFFKNIFLLHVIAWKLYVSLEFKQQKKNWVDVFSLFGAFPNSEKVVINECIILLNIKHFLIFKTRQSYVTQFHLYGNQPNFSEQWCNIWIDCNYKSKIQNVLQ